MELIPKITRFRAYQLGIPGSLFSYFDGTQFTLIEANLTDLSTPNLITELGNCGKKTIDILHITSWDEDHCSPSGLEQILKYLKPKIIEFPGYSPHNDCGNESLKIIEAYKRSSLLSTNNIYSQNNIVLRSISPSYILNLKSGQSFEYVNVLYSPRNNYEKSNDNSLVKLFRTGSFIVLSLGDVESLEISKSLLDCSILTTETDVIILAHHGANNGFTTDEFIKRVKPSVAICSSNYDNQFEHPRQEVRKILNDNYIPLYTTKTGDIIIESIGDQKSKYGVINLQSNSKEVSSKKEFLTKKAKIHFSPMLQNIFKSLNLGNKA